MLHNDELVDNIRERCTAALNGDGSVFTKVQMQAIGWALSEIRHQLRQEQAAAVAELAARIDALEGRVAESSIGKANRDAA